MEIKRENEGFTPLDITIDEIFGGYVVPENRKYDMRVELWMAAHKVREMCEADQNLPSSNYYKHHRDV